MKKYFRTKENNIYKRLFNDGAIIGANMGSSCCDKNLNPIGETIIKESDTIEDLCDYAIYYNAWDELIFRQLPLTTSMASVIKNVNQGLIKDVKFGILTDKGLIYVAKMNDKGEFELL